TVPLVVAFHALPLLLALLLRVLQWPQLLRPAGVAVVALGVKPLAVLLGRVAGGTVTGRWWSATLPSLLLLDPVNLSLLLFGLCLGRRAWRGYGEYVGLVPPGQLAVPASRRAVAGGALTAAVLFAVILAGYHTWGGFLYVRSGEETGQHAQAVQLFNEGQ